MTFTTGALDREVTIQARTDATSTGFPADTWTTLEAGVWMARQAPTGAERFRAAQLSAVVETTWVCHYREDMDPDLVDVARDRRLVYQGRIYDITSVTELERLAVLELRTLGASGS